ncbi:sigma-70 family RNA polymerase sigma factor [Nonomuraea sp. SBT364]|uniref:sigma-70 family RNA polymerase sigma factor n=1 Tax=Nonomuraea sp. SBT364 TaxID=1580530 RepID=UPI00066BDE14|nr:sigma-70 family RNA polymerase sigma factor [Nonomuraea sp. SBT364]
MTGKAPHPETLTPGDELARLYQAHRLELVRLAVLLLGDRETAEDAVQDVFARLHGKPAHVLTLPYIRTCVLNASRSLLRRRAVALRRTEPALEAVASAEMDALLGESRQEMLTALSRLPQRQREVLVLRYYLDLSDAEIARVTRIRQSTVRSTAARAPARLQRELG